jgi:hypothetical protein
MKPMFSSSGSACDRGIGDAERNRRRWIVAPWPGERRMATRSPSLITSLSCAMSSSATGIETSSSKAAGNALL